MIHSIFNIGKAVVRRIIPFGTTDDDEEDSLDNLDKQVSKPEDRKVTSVDTFLEDFRKLSSASPFTVDTNDLERTIKKGTQEWYSVLISRNGLLTLLNATSTESQQFLDGHFFGNKMFFDAILANSSISVRQLAAGVKESAVMRRHVYLLLVMLSLHSYDGYVLVYKTVNLVERDHSSGMFHYMTEEISATTDASAEDKRSVEQQVDSLIPPLALMVVLFAGGNGFFIESHLRPVVHGSKLLTSLVEEAKKKWPEEKRGGRSELPTLKEPSTRDCTPQISLAVEMLEEAERSSDKILVWLQKFAGVSTPSTTSAGITVGTEPATQNKSEYVLQLGRQPEVAAKVASEVTPKAMAEVTPKVQRQESAVETNQTIVLQTQTSEVAKAPEVSNVAVKLTSLPSVVTFDQFVAGGAAVPIYNQKTAGNVERQVSNLSADVSWESEPSSPKGEELTAQTEEAVSSNHGTVPPAPPPPPMEMQNGVMVSAYIPRSHMKPLRWTKLDTTPDVVEGTVWDALDVSVDTSNLLELFSNDKMSGKYQVDAGHHSNTGDTSNSIISAQTELHINVILKQFPDIDPEELAQRIQNLSMEEFDESQLKELLAAIPSDQEFLQIEHLKNSQEPLKPAESFLLSLLKVDHLKLRLEVMHFVSSFPVTARSILHNCEDIGKACSIIQSSVGFKKFLQLVLKVGNQMNEGRAIGSAVAFDTTILPKLTEVSSNESHVSLLHFLIERIQEDSPDILHFLGDLEPVLSMAETPLNQMKAEVIAAKIKYGQLMEEIQDLSEDNRSSLLKVLQTVRGRVGTSNAAVSKTMQLVQNLAVYLIEDPGEFQINQYLEMLKMFVQSVHIILVKPVRHESISFGAGSPKVPHKVSHEHSTLKDNSPMPAYAAPMMNDPRLAGVFQSLRNELKSSMAANSADE